MERRPGRNRLVWIDDAAWQQIGAGVTDDEARAIVAHWRVQRLPLVVRAEPRAVGAGRIAVGLPAPSRWSRRRLALEVSLDAVSTTGAFPALWRATRHYRWGRAAFGLCDALAAAGAATGVYGSHGWQLLTGERYVRDASDIDLCVEVADFDVACRVVQHLEAARLARRLDGELAFPDGSALAWREFARMRSQRTREVLVKTLRGPRLVPARTLEPMTKATASA